MNGGGSAEVVRQSLCLILLELFQWSRVLVASNCAYLRARYKVAADRAAVNVLRRNYAGLFSSLQLPP